MTATPSASSHASEHRGNARAGDHHQSVVIGGLQQHEYRGLNSGAMPLVGQTTLDASRSVLRVRQSANRIGGSTAATTRFIE